MKTSIALLLIFLLPLRVWAIDLEEPPDSDVGEVDQAAEGMSVEDIRVVKLSDSLGKPLLDGVLDDDFWKDAQLLDIGKELYPVRFADAIVKTDVLVAVSGTHLYLGITAHDPRPEEMRSSVRLKDGVKDGDYVSIVIDTTGNLRRKLEFRVNPHGSVTDVLQNTISDRYIYDWDTRWKAEAEITSSGYVVEMEIPIASIKQPKLEVGKTANWLVILKRTYPRSIDRTFGAVYIFEKEIRSELFVQRKKRLEMIPYMIYHPDEERNKDERFEQIKDHDN
jgi:hypothetical protein